jgi:hypothetical protein
LFTVKKRQPEEPSSLEKELDRLLDVISKTDPTSTKRTPQQDRLETELNRVLDAMSSASPETKEYSEMATQYVKLTGLINETAEYELLVDQIVKLHKLKEADAKKRVSPDTIAVIAGNLVGIGMVIGYERAGAITSRAFGLVMKLAR